MSSKPGSRANSPPRAKSPSPKAENAPSRKQSAKAAAEEPPAEVPPPALSGTGTFYYKSGATYSGDWKYDLPPEPAVPVEPVKKPTKKKGKAEEAPVLDLSTTRKIRIGKGKYQEGDYSYEGEWDNDEMHGQGKFVYASGAVYEGGWSHNKYHGKGKYTWPDGRTYEGEWQENKMHGHGVYTDIDGRKWEGQFFNGSGPGLTCQL